MADAPIRAVVSASLDPHAPVDIPPNQRIFTNRTLRMDDVDVIGFDMDYTLARYNEPDMELLSMRLTLEKLVAKRGYPEEILSIDYDLSWAIRGLVVDLQEGNVLKMDRHRHVGIACHGKRRLTREERTALYRTEPIRMTTERYAWLDTLFALPEAVIYIHLIDYLEAKGPVDPRKLWHDIRFCIDEAHRDDTLKSEIRRHLYKYIVQDPELSATLYRLKTSGKRLFLLTNSDYSYTREVMGYLLDGKMKELPTWREYFDIVVVSGAKPSFFAEGSPFEELDDKTGDVKGKVTEPFTAGKIYQGGNLADFERLCGTKGDRVLYIGDHIYGDMLRAKKSSIWRTIMVIQELEHEIAVAEQQAERATELVELDRKLRNLDAEIDFQLMLTELLRRQSGGGAVAALELAQRHVGKTTGDLEKRRVAVADEYYELLRAINTAHNPHWGPIFKVGVENSRFAEQVEMYACLYTSRVGNLLAYSPLRVFRSPRATMPHEL